MQLLSPALGIGLIFSISAQFFIRKHGAALSRPWRGLLGVGSTAVVILGRALLESALEHDVVLLHGAFLLAATLAICAGGLVGLSIPGKYFSGSSPRNNG